MLGDKLITFKKFCRVTVDTSEREIVEKKIFGENSIHTSHIFRFYSLLFPNSSSCVHTLA